MIGASAGRRRLAMSLAGARPIAMIQTASRNAAEPFYADALGLPRTGDDGFSALFDLDGVTLRLTEIPDYSAARPSGARLAGRGHRGGGRCARPPGMWSMNIYPGLGQDETGHLDRARRQREGRFLQRPGRQRPQPDPAPLRAGHAPARPALPAAAAGLASPAPAHARREGDADRRGRRRAAGPPHLRPHRPVSAARRRHPAVRETGSGGAARDA